MTQATIIQAMSRIYRDLSNETQVRAEIQALMHQCPAEFGRFLLAGLEELIQDNPRVRALADQVLDRLAVRLATDTWTGTEGVRHQLQQLVERSVDRSQAMEPLSGWRPDQVLNVTVVGDNGFEEAIDLAVHSRQGQFHHIQAGFYRVSVHGRVLWQGQLEDEHLLLTGVEQAPLRVAAATEASSPSGSLHLNLLMGALQMDVYPGIEDGTIQFTREADA